MTIDNLMNTSTEDCRQSLRSITDLAFLHDLLARCIAAGHVTRQKLVQSRIKALESSK